MTEIFRIKQGDYHRRLEVETDLDLTGATAVQFRMTNRATGELVVNRAGTIAAPFLRLQFVAPDLATPGEFDLVARVTFDDGQETVPTSGRTPVVVEPNP